MGITVIQKSDLSARKAGAKIALVLAGGVVTGGAFKLGGLKALDDFFVNRKTTEFDVYVGLSAGAFLAAPLGSGVGPAEMVRSIEGQSTKFSPFRAGDFYNPNVGELIEKPLRYLLDLFTFVPGSILDFVSSSPKLLENLREPLADAIRRPTPGRLQRLAGPIVRAIFTSREFPFPIDYLPSGFFNNARIERYLRDNLERSQLPNDFKELYRKRRRELFIVAMNVDTGERVVFGHNENASVTISQAVQASTALPGFYKPARLNGIDYVDGGVRRTANIDVAIEHGAELIICYNPFRPIYNRITPHLTPSGTYHYDGVPLANRGLVPLLNQVFRTLLHSRLQQGLRLYQEDPSFRGDIIVVEPPESDTKFFRSNPVAFWERQWAVKHGYDSVTRSFDRHFERIRPILESYGIHASRDAATRWMQQVDERSAADADISFLTEDFVPERSRRAKLSVAS